MILRQTNDRLANAASHGLQARAGGIIENNLFYMNAIGMSFGLVHGSPVAPGGVTGRVVNNVILGSKRIGGADKSIGIEIGNVKSPGVHADAARGEPSVDGCWEPHPARASARMRTA